MSKPEVIGGKLKLKGSSGSISSISGNKRQREVCITLPYLVVVNYTVENSLTMAYFMVYCHRTSLNLWVNNFNFVITLR